MSTCDAAQGNPKSEPSRAEPNEGGLVNLLKTLLVTKLLFPVVT